MVTIFYFGSLPDLLGRGLEQTELPRHVNDLQSLLHWLSLRGGNWQILNRRETVHAVVNREHSHPRAPITDHDQVSILSDSPLNS